MNCQRHELSTSSSIMEENVAKIISESDDLLENKVSSFNLDFPVRTENIEDVCDFKTFDIMEIKSEPECNQCENTELPLSMGEVADDKIAEIKQELPDELDENISVKQEYPDSEEINKERDIKQEPEEGKSAIWIKQELTDINHFISENNENTEEFPIPIKQEYDMENVSANETGNIYSPDTEHLIDEDVSFVCEIPPEENAEEEFIPNILHKCSKCPFVGEKISVLNRHMNITHTKLKCTWCDFHTFETAQLKAHVQRVHVQNTYKTINGSAPEEVNNLTVQKTPPKVKLQIIDIRKPGPSNPEKSNECLYCEFVGRGPRHLKKHILLHCNLENFTQYNITQHSCPYCQFVTEHKKEYMAHKMTCLRYRCSENFCRFMTSVKEDLWDHIVKEHRNQNNFIGKYYLYKPPYKCSQKFCRFSTTVHEDYLHHIEVHKKRNDCMEKNKKYSRNYKCSEENCEYTTKIREELWDHIIKEHRKQKDLMKYKKLRPIYKCSEKLCKFNTNFHKNFLEHIDVHRRAKECSGKTRKFGGVFKCSEKLCEFSTKFREQLWDHIIEVHRTEKTTELHVKCHWCSFSSDQTLKLKEHVQKVHVRSTYKSTNIQK